MDPERSSGYPFISQPGATPLVVSRAEGAYLYTPDPKSASGERAILDAAGGAVVSNVGHGRREVGEAFARASMELTYAVPPFATNARVELVERLRDRWLPNGLTRAAFTSGGSESVDAAIRLARQHHISAGRPSRWKVIGRDLSYHGVTLATLDIGGHLKRRKGFEPYLSDVPKAPACYCLRCPLGQTYPSCKVACATALEEIVDREGADTIAAVYHSCYRTLCPNEAAGGIEVVHYTRLIADALGLPGREELFKPLKIAGDPAAAFDRLNARARERGLGEKPLRATLDAHFSK